jgi:hypothetical protein
MKKIKVAPRDLSNNGKVQRKVAKSTLYARHEVDQDAGLVGKRYATRTAGSTRQYGMANGYDHLEAVDFLFGAELIQSPIGCMKVVNGITGMAVGFAKPADAMAYKIAAMRRGIVLEVYNDVEE